MRIGAGAVSGSAGFVLRAHVDAVSEVGGEKVAVSGVLPGFSVAGAELTIHDAVVSLGLTDAADPPAALTELGEDGGAQRVRVVASVPAAAPAKLNVAVTVAASGSTASAADYMVDRTSMTVKIRAGREVGYSPVLTVTPVDDRRVEGDETIVFSGSTSAVGYSAIADASVSLNIVDDDDDAVVLSLDKPAVLEWDGGQTVEVTASFAGATGSDLTSASDVVVSVAGGSGGDGATAGSLGTGDFRRIWRVVRLR